MSETTIVLPIDEATANLYNAASPEEKRKVQLLFRVLIREVMLNNDVSLTQVMDEISKEAQERGLTPDLLEDILRDDP